MKKTTQYLLPLSLVIALLSSACYSFKGVTIDPNVNTFYVAPFDVTTEKNFPATLSNTFSERLKDKIRQESRLNYNDENPDIEFSGAITNYEASFEAPQPNETTAFNRLTIEVTVEYLNHKKDDEKKTMSRKAFRDYPTTDNLISVQDDLIAQINNDLVEEIFNWAFNDW